MKFIMIKDASGGDVAVNTDKITEIQIFNGVVCLTTGGTTPISTGFLSIQEAVEYVQDPRWVISKRSGAVTGMPPLGHRDGYFEQPDDCFEIGVS
jgi:hypothetical protein